MKKTFNLRAILALAFALAVPAAAQATTYSKADNTNSLDQAVSWGGTAPGSGDVATWSGTYSASYTNTATGPTPGPTNSLLAVLPGSAVSWQGITISTLAGTALTTNSFASNLAATNITAATEATVSGYGNVVTITTKANHAYAIGQSVTISGVTPAGYNGTYIVNGVPSATTFTYTNATAGLAAGTAFGTVQSAIYIGGLGAATASSALTIGTSGIDLSAANVSANLNAVQFAFSGNQTWNVAAGRILHFGASGTGGANAKAVTSGSDGTITISGGGIVDLNQGGASGFADAAGWAGFSGKWIINSGATLRGLRNGGTAFGANSSSDAITLNGGTLAVGGISGDVGNWTWNTPITLATSTTSAIDEHNVTGVNRYLKLNQIITGAGNLIFKDTGSNGLASAFNNVDLGYILTGANDFSGTLTIGGPVENGIAGRLTPVRIGGSQTSGTDVGTGTGVAGTLGTGNVVNNGVLTFLSSSPSMSVANLISGTGTLRIGSLNYGSYAGATVQNVTLSAANTYTGPTLINSGTLTLGAGGSIANSSAITIFTNATFDVTASGFATVSGQTLNILGGTVNGNLALPTGSTNLLAPGGSNTVGTLNISGNLNLSGGTNIFVLDINNSANDQISVGGNLTASGVTVLQFLPPGTGLNAGTYPLITAASVTAAPANFQIVGLVAGARPQTFSISISGGTVNLVVVGSPGNLTWVGDGTANVWSTATTFSNWFNQVTSAKDIFVQNDLVTFDDTGSASPAINLTGIVQPGAITLNNSSANYTFSGVGHIAGSGVFTMNGPGNVTMLTSNNFNGTMAINGGTLTITNEAALGEPTNNTVNSVMLNGGALLVTNTMIIGINTNRGFLIGSSGGTIIVTNASTLTVSNVLGDTTGSSILTKAGNGTLILNGLDNYGGGTVVQNGTVIYGNGQALGRGGNTSGTSGFFAPPFELDNGVVDINGQSTYQPNFAGGSDANGTPVVLYNGTLNFVGQPGGTLTFQDSGAVPSGWGSTVATVLYYNAANNPGTLNITARFCSTGTSGTSTRTFTIDDSAATTTEVNIAAPMGVLSLDPTNQDSRNVTIIKNGAGTLQISAANNFPVMEVDAGTLRVNHPQALGADRSISTAVSGGSGTPNLVIVTAGTVDLNGFSPAIGGLSDNATATGLVLNNGTSASTLTLGASLSNTVFNATYTSVIADGTRAVSLNKIGTNTQVLAGINTYSGTTTVSNGALLINGQMGLGAATNLVTVAGGALGGSGTVNAPVTVQSGGTLAPGAGTNGTATLTINASLTLAGTTLMNVNKDIATNDLVALAAGTVSYGGVLSISTNQMASTTLVLGDSFKLFSAPAQTGNFTSIAGSPGTGLGWTFNPASGVLSVITIASNPTNLSFSISGNTMTLSWPADHLGWVLQSQTNSLSVGLTSSNWVDVPGGSFTVTSTTLPIVSGNPSVFYRLRHP